MAKQDKATHRGGRLTRDGMVRVIEEGGSVAHEGRLYTKVDDLPSEAELTEGDAEAAAQAKAALDRQLFVLTAQRAALDATESRAIEAERRKSVTAASAESKSTPAEAEPTPAESKSTPGPKVEAEKTAPKK